MFQKRLKYLRTNKGFSQQNMADFLGISRQGYGKYEDGKSEPDHNTLIKLSNYFNVTTDYLLGKSDNPDLTEEEAFDAFRNDPSLERWYKELPKSKEEDLRRLRKIWEAFKEDD